MANHLVYRAIIDAVRIGSLVEPFSVKDFRQACLGFKNRTYEVFLHKHRRDNPGGESELFIKVSPGRFKLIRPYMYGF